MKLKSILTTLACILGIAGAAAEDAGNYLHVLTDKGWQIISLDKVDRLTFAGGTMTATDANGTTVATFPQSTLQTIAVKETSTTAISAPEVDATFRITGTDVEIVTGGAFEVYSISGTRLVNIPNTAPGHIVSLSGLNHHSRRPDHTGSSGINGPEQGSLREEG